MPSKFGMIATAASLVLSIASCALLGPHANMPIHWNIPGQADLSAPVWLMAMVFPILCWIIAALPRLVSRARFLGGSPDRTSTMIALVILVAQAYLVMHSAFDLIQPRKFAVTIVGAMFAIVGNYHSKDFPDSHIETRSSRSRLPAYSLFLIGIVLIVVGTIW